jgi:hypothetical protein
VLVTEHTTEVGGLGTESPFRPWPWHFCYFGSQAGDGHGPRPRVRGAGLPSQRAKDAGARHWRDDGPKVDSPLDWAEAGAGLRVAVSVLGPVSSPRDRSWAREAVFGLGPVFSPRTEAGPCVGGFALISKTSHHTQKNKKLLLR